MKQMSEGGAKTGEGRRGRRGRKTRPSMGRQPVRREGKTIVAARAPSGGAGGCGRRGGRLRRGLPAAHGPGGQPTLLPTPPPSLSPSLSLSLPLSLSLRTCGAAAYWPAAQTITHCACWEALAVIVV